MVVQLGKIKDVGKAFRESHEPFMPLTASFTACSKVPDYAMVMKMNKSVALLCVTGLFMTGMSFMSGDVGAREPERRGPRGEQDQARRAMLEGRVMPFSVIKRKIEREMGDATYVGSEFHQQSNRYRLKYVRNGRVVWVDVDGRTGDIAGWAH